MASKTIKTADGKTKKVLVGSKADPSSKNYVAPKTSSSSGGGSSTADLLAKGNAMLAQTAAEGSKPFAGSSYDTSAKSGAATVSYSPSGASAGKASTNPVKNVSSTSTQTSNNANLEAKLALAKKAYGLSQQLAKQSTTTLSSDKTTDITNAQIQLKGLSETGATSNPETGITQDASGAVWEPYEAPKEKKGATSSGGYYKSVYYPPGAEVPTDERGKPVKLTASDPTNDYILKTLVEERSKNDALTARLLNNVQSQFQSLVAQQEKENENQRKADLSQTAYLTNSMITSGALRGDVFSNDYIQASTERMKDNIDAGLSAIADLRVKEETALVTAISAGQQQDFRLQEKLIDTVVAIRDEKVKAVTKLSDDLIAAKKDARDFAYKVSQDKIDQANKVLDQQLESEKFTYQQKKDALDLALNRGQLSEQQRHNKAMEALDNQRLIDARKVDDAKDKDPVTKAGVAIDVANNKIALIDSLLNSKGLAGSVGTYGISRFTPFTADKAARQEFAAGVNQLVSKDTIDTLLALKAQGGTLGALSDQERILLQSAATKIGTWMQRDKNRNPTGKFEVSEEDFKAELNTMKSLAEKARDRAAENILSPEEKAALDSEFIQDEDPASYY